MACAAGCGRNEPPPNVLLVVVDTLRQDRLEPYGYAARATSPALAALERESVVVAGLTCSSSWTLPSVATLFTGLDPVGHRVSRMRDRLEVGDTLAELYAAAGYSTACVMSNFLLAGRGTSFGIGFDQGFEHWDGTVARKPEPHRGITAPEVTRSGLAWLERADPAKPWLLVLHYFDPHAVYEDNPAHDFADPGYEGWVRGGLSTGELRAHQVATTAADRDQLGAFYDEEVRAVDDALAAVLAALRARPDFERTLVVVTADHGEELAERGRIGHNHSLHAELVDLPLLVRLPGGAGAGTRVSARLPQRDLYATLLELCGLQAPSGRGRSFAAILRGTETPRDRDCWMETDFVPALAERSEKRTHMRGLIAGGHKLVQDLERGGWSLYDLAADPAEAADLAGAAGARALREELAARVREHAWFEREP